MTVKPDGDLLPLAVLVVPTTYLSAASIVAFGAWFPMATMTTAPWLSAWGMDRRL